MSKLPPAPSRLPNAPLPSPIHLSTKKHLLLCATGSVATIKLPLIAQALSTHVDLSIRIILTPSAMRFLLGQSAEQPHFHTLREYRNVDAVYVDEDEWETPWVRGGSVLHIELRRWADLCVVAPLSANSLAGMVGGRCEGLLQCVVRAWDVHGFLDRAQEHVEGQDIGEVQAWRQNRKRIIIVAPAMNTAMWMHPVTAAQVEVLDEDWGVKKQGWFEVLMPIAKEIACGDIGAGGMREWREVVEVIEERMELKKDRAKERIADHDTAEDYQGAMT